MVKNDFGPGLLAYADKYNWTFDLGHLTLKDIKVKV